MTQPTTNMTPEKQSEIDLQEVKIRTITNGWLVKTTKGWWAYPTLEKVYEHISYHYLKLAQEPKKESGMKGETK